MNIVVDGAASEWIPVVSAVPQGIELGSLMFIVSGDSQASVLGSHMFVPHTSEMFDLLENGMFGYADDSTLLAGVGQPANRPAVAVSLKLDLFRIHLWCNRCHYLVDVVETYHHQSLSC